MAALFMHHEVAGPFEASPHLHSLISVATILAGARGSQGCRARRHQRRASPTAAPQRRPTIRGWGVPTRRAHKSTRSSS